MSEMNAEKKKDIERYIIKSYFSGGKNVESFVRGADIIKGTDDGYIPQLIVEVTYFGGSGDVMINWDIYDDEQLGPEWKNSFALRVCKERTIEKNRCDAVDAMSYAWEAWRERIQGKPIFLKTNDEDLQKDKRIEELEREVKALRAEKEVMDRHIQELESHNVSLAETNTALENSKDSYLRMIQNGATYLKDWEEATGCAKPENVKRKIYALERECRVWHDAADHQLEQIHSLEGDISDLYDKNEELKSQIKEWKEKTQRCTPFLAGLRINVLRDSDTRYRNLLFGEAKPDIMVFVGGEKKTIRKYLRDKNFASVVNAINELESEIDAALTKYTEWQKATGCKYPAEARILLEKWKVLTKCETPEAAATLVTLYESSCELLDELGEGAAEKEKEWQDATGYACPEDFLRGNELAEGAAEREKAHWQDATGRISPEAAKQYIDRLKARLNKIHEYSVDWD